MCTVELNGGWRENSSLHHYFKTMGKFKSLTREEEYTLAQRIRRGDRDALDKLVNANLRLVASVAQKFLNKGLNHMDLIAEGTVGLIVAAKRFDERLGHRFASFADLWIRQSIQEALADQINTIPLSP